MDSEQVQAVVFRSQLPFHLGDDVHDVGVALDAEEFRHLDAADLGHPAHVVAPQVHQHQVLGPLLGVGQQLRFQGLVFCRAWRPGAGCRRWAGS